MWRIVARPECVYAGGDAPCISRQTRRCTHMLVLGLTGNIGSGKSEVARVLARLGAVVIDSDRLARRAVQRGAPALDAIVQRWGVGVLRQDGTLDRAALRRIVFADPTERKALDAIVHPEVARLRDEQLAAARAEGERVVVLDIPLLFEAGLRGIVDRVILVDAPEDVRLDRLVRLRGLDAEEARRMMASQMSAAEKRQLADAVIENAGSLEDLQAETERVWMKLGLKANP